MKIIVTGGEGFIGKALVAKLRNDGAEVIVVDRRIGIEAGDYFASTDISGINCVYHLAAQTSVFNRNKSDIIRDNIETFKTVCDTCERARVRLVYASSSTADGSNTTSLYGISKRFDEEYARCYNPQATGVRLHNVYGPDPRQGTLLWHLLNRRLVRLVNNGENIRHFTYISDVVDGLSGLIRCRRNIVNLANPEETSILKFARTVSLYNSVELELVSENRHFDNFAQEVNSSFYTLPLAYTPVEEGIKQLMRRSD